MDALAIVKHLNSLAQKSENRETIVKVIFLAGLVVWWWEGGGETLLCYPSFSYSFTLTETLLCYPRYSFQAHSTYIHHFYCSSPPTTVSGGPDLFFTFFFTVITDY